MNPGGDAAEQVVRLSLEGFEVAARLTGAAAKDVALLLASVLREQTKTKGRARLTSMLRSGRELKVFTIPGKDLERFTQQARRYGVLYCVLRDKSGNAPVDIIARADDASKIQRIVERYRIGTVERGAVTGTEKGDREKAGPFSAKTGGAPLSEKGSDRTGRPDAGRAADARSRPPVKQKLKDYTDIIDRSKAAARSVQIPDPAGDLLKQAVLRSRGIAK